MKESAHARRQPFSRHVRTTRSVQAHLNCPEPVYRQNRSIDDAFSYAVTPARVCDMWNIKQEYDSHYSFPPPRNVLIVAAISPTSELAGTFSFASIAPFSAPRFSQSRVRCSRRLYKELSSFDMAPFKTCETFLGMSYLWQLCCFKQEVSTRFLLCIRYHHTHTRTRIQFEIAVKEQYSSTGSPDRICSKPALLTLRKGHNYADSQAHSQAGSQAYRCLGWRDR